MIDDSLNGRVKLEKWRDMSEDDFTKILDKEIHSMRWKIIFLRRDLLKEPA